MSTNTLILAILGVMLFAWAAYLGTERSSPWVFPLWFPLTATTAIGTLFCLLTLPTMCSRGGGEAQGWAAYGASMAFLFLLPSPVLFAISLWQRPKESAYSIPIVLVTLI